MNPIHCVLLVDDNPATNFYHQKVLASTGLVERVEQVVDGQEALSYLKRNQDNPLPEVIFLDINMPKMNGFQFLKRFRELDIEDKDQIQIIFLSSSSWEKDKTMANDSDFVHDFVEKPLTADYFTDLVRKKVL